jgi:hypothetical protein
MMMIGTMSIDRALRRFRPLVRPHRPARTSDRECHLSWIAQLLRHTMTAGRVVGISHATPRHGVRGRLIWRLVWSSRVCEVRRGHCLVKDLRHCDLRVVMALLLLLLRRISLLRKERKRLVQVAAQTRTTERLLRVLRLLLLRLLLSRLLLLRIHGRRLTETLVSRARLRL